MNRGLSYINPKSVFLFFIVIALSFKGIAQESKPSQFDTTHSPRKATIYSAVLPGLGQYYNKKYWKIPIVYAAIGGCLTAALINNKQHDIAKKELIYRNDNPGLRLSSQYSSFEDAQLLELSDYYRKWRDNMFIFTGLAYVLNIIDANVDANLFNFNVNKDLSLNLSPYTFSQEYNRPVAGLSFRLNFK